MNEVFIRAHFSSNKVFCGPFHLERSSGHYIIMYRIIKGVDVIQRFVVFCKLNSIYSRKIPPPHLDKCYKALCCMWLANWWSLMAEARNRNGDKKNSVQCIHTTVHRDRAYVRKKLGVYRAFTSTPEDTSVFIKPFLVPNTQRAWQYSFLTAFYKLPAS